MVRKAAAGDFDVNCPSHSKLRLAHWVLLSSPWLSRYDSWKVEASARARGLFHFWNHVCILGVLVLVLLLLCCFSWCCWLCWLALLLVLLVLLLLVLLMTPQSTPAAKQHAVVRMVAELNVPLCATYCWHFVFCWNLADLRCAIGICFSCFDFPEVGIRRAHWVLWLYLSCLWLSRSSCTYAKGHGNLHKRARIDSIRRRRSGFTIATLERVTF